MNDFYQQDKLSNQQLNDHDDENNISKDAYVVQVTQHWKLQSLNSQHSSDEHISQPYVDQHLSTSNLSNQISSTHTDKNSNKDELSEIVDESNKSLITMKQRVTPVPASYVRRRPNLIKQSSNPKLLTPRNKTKLGNTGATTKKATPVFIAPKKTSPQPHSFSSLSFDDSLQTKRKPILERQTAFVDDPNTSSAMTTWTPTPLTPLTRFPFQSSGNSIDESSSDESDHESLIIRKKNSKIKKQEYHASFPTYGNIPSTIFITDPYGHSHTFDPDNDVREKIDHDEQISDDDLNSTNTNTLFPNSTFESSSPEIVLIPPTPPIIHDKHTLQSIGEEEEEEEEEEKGEEYEDNNQTKLNVHNKDDNQIDKEPLGRRWSDGVVDQEEKQIPSSQSPLIKMSSATSITKQTENPPIKVSKTKYLLMKLHLTSSSKDDETTTSPPKKRTVRRSTDKNRYLTQ